MQPSHAPPEQTVRDENSSGQAKPSRNQARIALLATLALLLALSGYQRYKAHQDEIHTAATTAVNQALAQQMLEKWKRTFRDSAADTIPTAYPRPRSDWLARQGQLHEKLIGSGPYDVVVAPLEIDGDGFDRGTRATMTAELATAISHAHLGTVLDPFLLSEALGDGLREFDLEDLYRIADAVGARRVIFGAVGHNAGKMSIALRTQERPARHPDRSPWASINITFGSVDKIPFDDEHPPIECFSKQLPGALKSIGIEWMADTPGSPVRLDLTQLPPSPHDLIKNDGNAALSAYTFIILGLLTPARLEHTREHFAAKAFAATTAMAVSSPEFRALRARAYMMLGYRMAALRTLGATSNPEEQELVAALNGSLPEVRDLAASEHNPLKHLIAALDAHRIAADYQVETRAQALADVQSMGLPGQIWPYLVARAVSDSDEWSQFDNDALKMLLDREFPIEGLTLQDIIRGNAALGSTDKIRTAIDLSFLNHAQQYVAKGAAASHRLVAPVQPTDLDYLELLTAIGHDNLLRHIRLLAYVQDNPEAALAEAARIESVYRGHPDFAVVRARAEQEAAERAAGAAQEGLIKAAYEDAVNSLYWEQSQSRVASDAIGLVAAIGPREYGQMDNLYHTDLPYHPQYLSWGGLTDPGSIEKDGLAALRSATSEFDVVIKLVGDQCRQAGNPEFCDQVGKLIAARFTGSPQRTIFMSDLELLHGNNTAAETLLRDNIRSTPDFEPSYFRLGTLELQSGLPREAAHVFLSYPGFKHGGSADPVMIANQAGEIGSYFYRSGDFALAIPFYRIAAAQRTGASSEMSAQFRLQVLSGDVTASATLALQLAQRYNNVFAFRDYMGILHAANQSAVAWSAFRSLVGQESSAAIWESALVGHHREGASQEAVLAWIQHSGFAADSNPVGHAAGYLTQFVTTDRVPAEQLADAIAEIGPAWQMEDAGRAVVRPDAHRRRIAGPNGTFKVLPEGGFEREKKHRVRSDLAFFVAAYRAIKLGEFKAARQTFEEAAHLYELSSPESSYMLPYYALAVARSAGETAPIQALLSRFAPQKQQFDYQLAHAVLDAMRGETDQSLKSLRLARYRRGNNDDRPTLTQFTYGDICDELYRMTGNAAIRAEALDWAKARERAEPWQAWSYALESELAADSVDRERAIAMTSYLDPQSARLATLKKSEVAAAVKHFSSWNIFLPKPTAAKSGPGAI